MLVINPMTADARVDKEASSLGRAGHDVTVLATMGPGLPTQEDREGYRLVRRPYQRVIKDRIVARRRGATARSRDLRRALETARRHPTRGRSALPADLVARAHLTGLRAQEIVDNAAYAVGGGTLKTLRSRIMPVEYWRGLVEPAMADLGRFDVVHCHDLGTLEAGCRAARLHEGAPSRVVYDSHEYYVEQNTSWTAAERRLWQLHEARWIRRADAVITVSGSIADALRSRYRLARTPSVVHNAPPPPSADVAMSDVRTDAGVGDVPLAVYVGGVKPGRGVEHLVPALPLAERWHLAIIGAGHTSSGHLKTILDAAAEAGVADRVHALDAVPASTLPTYLRTATLGVHPMEPICLNHEYALPNKLFDYVFAGLPVAVSDLTEMRGFVEEYEVGVTFDPYSPASVADAMDAVLDDDGWTRRAEAAVPAIRARFGWERQEQILLETYDLVVAGVAP